MVSPLKKVQMLQNIYAPHPKHAWLSGVVKDITFGKIKLHINDARVATVMLEEPLPAAYHTEGNCLYYTIPEENFYDQILPQVKNLSPIILIIAAHSVSYFP